MLPILLLISKIADLFMRCHNLQNNPFDKLFRIILHFKQLQLIILVMVQSKNVKLLFYE